jgi:hypothetical protein
MSKSINRSRGHYSKPSVQILFAISLTSETEAREDGTMLLTFARASLTTTRSQENRIYDHNKEMVQVTSTPPVSGKLYVDPAMPWFAGCR